MFQGIRLLAVDVDGTLITRDHRVLPEVKEAVHRAQRSGLTVLPSTARSPVALRTVLRDLEFEGPSVCFSGAWTGHVALDGTPATTLREEVLEPGTAHAIAEAIQAAGLVPNWYRGESWVVPRVAPETEREARTTDQSFELVPDLLAAVGAPNKILAVGPEELLVRIKAELTEVPGMVFDAVFSHANYMEFLPKAVDKASAVLAYAADLGLPARAVAAVGDAQNDIGMVRAAGLGVAMGNAVPAVKDVADWVTGTNEEGGVAQLIGRILAGA